MYGVILIMYMQVCPLGLHITMGIFLRLFVLLEDEGHKLYVRAVVFGGDCGISYKQYSSALYNNS